jgi:Icc-related predicted phosphoesterase
LAEYSKYDVLVKDLNLIETQVGILSSKYKDAVETNQDLENAIKDMQKENAFLVQKISKLEGEIENFQFGVNQDIFNTLNTKEKEEIKLKLKNLISKIDYHLSS